MVGVLAARWHCADVPAGAELVAIGLESPVIAGVMNVSAFVRRRIDRDFRAIARVNRALQPRSRSTVTPMPRRRLPEGFDADGGPHGGDHRHAGSRPNVRRRDCACACGRRLEPSSAWPRAMTVDGPRCSRFMPAPARGSNALHRTSRRIDIAARIEASRRPRSMASRSRDRARRRCTFCVSAARCDLV